ncbi:hypothetical protein [Streptomyces flavofungini]|uniref:Uncharacterized protein n=1 Tax=Streptomyces flavofungini TaxID=68200 RepID=A0ABS0X2H6_9ACTN|nr:hypothetical protein [Streptomyces flavofungini]MBJ3807386.1 hypothetical protein [Streptomyces flavofungini]GHC65840.1 hypothetical protein GCM10010349_38000 [Streptomyces flavofungini]
MAVIAKNSAPQHSAEAPEAPRAETLETLRGDCARMAPHWVVPAVAAAPVPPSLIHGVTVPAASARVIDGMSEYGN